MASMAGSKDVPTATTQLRDAQKLQSQHQRQLKRLKKCVASLVDYNLSQLCSADFRDSITLGDALLKDYTTNSDILQELMELADVTDIDDQTVDIEDDLEEIQRLHQELHRLLTLRQTYTEAVAVKSQTTYLLTANDVAQPPERKNIDALSSYLGRVAPLIKSLKSEELTAVYQELTDRAEVINKQRSDAVDATLKSDAATPSPHSSMPTTRPSTIALKLPSFCGDLLKWKDFWSLFTSGWKKSQSSQMPTKVPVGRSHG